MCNFVMLVRKFDSSLFVSYDLYNWLHNFKHDKLCKKCIKLMMKRTNTAEKSSSNNEIAHVRSHNGVSSVSRGNPVHVLGEYSQRRNFSQESINRSIINPWYVDVNNQTFNTYHPNANFGPSHYISNAQNRKHPIVFGYERHSVQNFNRNVNFYQILPFPRVQAFPGQENDWSNHRNMCFNSRSANVNRHYHATRAKSDLGNSTLRRSWQLTNVGKRYQNMKNATMSGLTFQIMSYNVLSQDLLEDHPYLYKLNERNALHWKHRWKVLFEEIKQHNCEVICLQEVQQNHLGKYFNSLKGLGYALLYKQKTGNKYDGCAIYYKKDLFTVEDYASVEYKQPASSILNRDNVGIVVKFALKDNTQVQFIVATTHLLYNPKRDDVRLAQTQVLLTEIDRLAYDDKKTGNNKYLPILITGDFNAVPSSPLYKLIADGVFKYEGIFDLRSKMIYGKKLISPRLRITDSCQHEALQNVRDNSIEITGLYESQLINLQNTDRKETTQNTDGDGNHTTQNADRDETTQNTKATNSVGKYESGTLSHNFAFKSAYKHVTEQGIEATTYQDKWVTVDYIFYSGKRDKYKVIVEDKLKLLSRYLLPTKQELKHVKIPNYELGSDHLALVAKFKLEFN